MWNELGSQHARGFFVVEKGFAAPPARAVEYGGEQHAYETQESKNGEWAASIPSGHYTSARGDTTAIKQRPW